MYQAILIVSFVVLIHDLLLWGSISKGQINYYYLRSQVLGKEADNNNINLIVSIYSLAKVFMIVSK